MKSALASAVALALAAAPALATVETTSIEVGPLVFDARVAGPDDGALVLLLHGFPQSSRQYAALLPALAGAGYRAVAFDQRGYSPGARPEAVADYAMRRLVGDVLGVADALGRERFHLVGHDWGAAVAWVVAALHPDRVLSLAALSTPHVSAFREALAAGGEQAARSQYMARLAAPDAEARLLADGAAGLRAIYQAASGAAGSPFSAEDVEAYVALLGEESALRGALNWYRAMAAGPAAAGPAPPPLPAIRIPTLYVWSDADPAFAAGPAHATGRFVEGPYRFEVIEGAGHWLLAERPERIRSLLLEHLGSLASPAAEARVETLRLSAELPSRGRLGGVAVGPDGTVYVSNFGGSVWRVATDGTTSRVPVSLQGSSGNAVLPDGSLLQASFLDDRVLRIDPAGEVSTFAQSEVLNGPVGIAVAESGDVYVCACRGRALVRIGPDGRATRFAESPLFECPNSVTPGPDGALYVVSYDNPYLARVDADGRVTLHATLSGEQNAHVAFTRGHFYVTRIADGRIDRVSADGTRVEHFAGTGEAGHADGPAARATLAHPNGIAAAPDGASLYFNDLVGAWKGGEETRLLLRRLTLEDRAS